MAKEIPKAYEPQQVEQHWARVWVEQKIFRAETSVPGPVFSIALPPPNVTGSIHIGHMLEHTQIDILARWHRMRGFRTLWLPGTDHAGIATQVVVERELAKQGLRRQQLGREEFERRVWEWKAQSGGIIKSQMVRLGASCDWTRERFTLDPPLYRAVLEAFLRLYHEGLIYRGRYMVNWCPRCQTALSDLEVAHEEQAGKLWHIRYLLAGRPGHLVVATTRPETLLGDTAVAVNPKDERYQKLLGKKVLLPLMNREIPIIADELVDREFGTGAVKVTPAHDPNDFEMAKRHHLPEVDIMGEDGRLTSAAGPYAGMDRFEARKKIIADLEAQGLLDRTTAHTYSVGLCDRCKTIVEPRLSTQWFCRMKPLAEPALQVVRDGIIPVVPENQKKILVNWLENIRDWVISRQLWWGHRIPIWHCDCGAMIPARDSRVEIVNGRAQAASPPEKCSACRGSRLTQDPDVLDTWFSSALWPFSTLGWPDETEDLRTFYPTSLLVSGNDILFFWDARMIMMGLHLMPREKIEERIPFRQLYLHAIVRDPHGIKMSKTRGNVVDPLEIIEKHGTDALRFTLAVMAAPGTDIALSEERILSYRAFANKIWNAARFLFMNVDKFDATGTSIEDLASPEVRTMVPHRIKGELPLVDRWAFSRLARVTAEVSEALEEFRFHEAAHIVYHFFWGDFCDWYIEWVRPQLAAGRDPAGRETATAAWRNLFSIFEAALRLLHPFMPFLTEELWHRLPQRVGTKSIALAPFPQAHPNLLDDDAEVEVGVLQEFIQMLRELRRICELGPKEKFTPRVEVSETSGVKEIVLANMAVVERLAGASNLRLESVGATRPDPSTHAIRSTAHFDVSAPLPENKNLQAELTRVRKELDRLTKDIGAKQQRLADDTFRSRAPAEIVRRLEGKLLERQQEYEKLAARLAQLEKSLGPSGESGVPAGR